MEAFNSYMNRQRLIGVDSLLDLTPLTQKQKSHLSKVYFAVLCGICFSAAGVYLQTRVFSFSLLLAAAANIGCTLGVFLTSTGRSPNTKVLTGTRVLLFGGAALFSGVTIGDFIHFLNRVNPTILPTAFFASLGIFVCFSGAALFAKERSYLYLGPLLTIGLSYLSMVHFFNIFFRSSFVFDIFTYGSLFIYMGFVIYDTQVTLEDFRRGNNDYLVHAMALYIDLFAIFVRILQILSEQEKKRDTRRD